MVAFSMTAEVKDFILDIPSALTVQAKDFVLKSLPLSLLMIWVIITIRVIGTVDEPKI
jgi:hypothetical protein